MSTEEKIARYNLQLEGLQSWPEGPERTMMTAWVHRQIKKLLKN